MWWSLFYFNSEAEWTYGDWGGYEIEIECLIAYFW